MQFESLSALVVFALVTSLTPGPNNLMLLTSGVNFGFRRTIPHMFGIAAGFCVLLLSVGFGLGALLSALPSLAFALKVAGGTYLLYLAWRIAFSRSLGSQGSGTGRPLTFGEAAAFQWVNPKAWAMALTAMAIHTNADFPVLSVVAVALAFALVNLPSVSVWAGFGQVLGGWLAEPVRLKWFNLAMGVALALTLVPMLG